jgi:photosystem II stability/assembly factor-like uncharacterized protein
MGTSASRDYVEGKSVPELLKTIDGGKTWAAVKLPRLHPIPAELQELASSSDQMACGVIELALISSAGIVATVECRIYQFDGVNPSVRKNIDFGYLSSDAGQNWHSWLSTGNEYFANAAVGWRLQAHDPGQLSELQHTTDAGQTWNTLKSVAWQEAQFDFIDEQEGWALVNIGDAAALVHTTDGGRTWTELKPVVANP